MKNQTFLEINGREKAYKKAYTKDQNLSLQKKALVEKNQR